MTFIRPFLLVAVTLLVATAAPRAHAGELGDAGTVSLSAEGLFGLVQTRDHWKTSPADLKVRSGTFGFFPAIPRVALDAAIARNVTLGLALGFLIDDSDSETTTVLGSSVTNTASNTFLLQPRVGYIVPINDSFRVWLRAGVSYTRVSRNAATDTKTSWFGLVVNPTLVYTPYSHVGFGLSAFADLPLGGHYKSGTISVDYTKRTLGVLCSVLAFF